MAEMAQILFPMFDDAGDRILLAPINNARAASLEQLLAVAAGLDTSATACASVEEAMDRAYTGGGTVVVSGSVYLVGEAKAWLKGRA